MIENQLNWLIKRCKVSSNIFIIKADSINPFLYIINTHKIMNHQLCTCMYLCYNHIHTFENCLNLSNGINMGAYKATMSFSFCDLLDTHCSKLKRNSSVKDKVKQFKTVKSYFLQVLQRKY